MGKEYEVDGKKVKPIYYYDQPYRHISVCILIEGEKVLARGIAICSPLDMFVKKIGRNKAFGRAVQALSSRRSNGRINPDRFGIKRPNISHIKQNQTMDLVKHAFSVYGLKSVYLPEVTQFERRLLSRTGAS